MNGGTIARRARKSKRFLDLIFWPVFANGGVVIDTPGMREFHLWLANEGSKQGFPDIEALSPHCRFCDCTHAKEKECAVLEALATGVLPLERYESFLKLQLEIRYLREAEKRAAWKSPKGGVRVVTRASRQNN